MTISPNSAATTACEALGWRISNLELQKLLYLAHMIFMGRNNGDLLISENFEAWDFGPVLSSLYQEAKIFGPDRISALPKVKRNLNLSEHKVIKEVVTFFGKKTPGELVDLTHIRGGAWDRHYIPKVRHIVIPNSDILNEYKNRNHALG